MPKTSSAQLRSLANGLTTSMVSWTRDEMLALADRIERPPTPGQFEEQQPAGRYQRPDSQKLTPTKPKRKRKTK